MIRQEQQRRNVPAAVRCRLAHKKYPLVVKIQANVRRAVVLFYSAGVPELIGGLLLVVPFALCHFAIVCNYLR